jgi:DNA-binding NtrC family response regulator
LPPKVLVIDDDLSLCEALTLALEDEWEVHTVTTGQAGLALLQEEAMPVVLLDLRLPDMDGLAVLQRIKATTAATEVLILTAHQDVPVVVRAIQQGAADFLTKPLDVDTLRARVRTAWLHARQRWPAPLLVSDTHMFVGDVVIGPNAAMHAVWDLLQRVAETTATVLLLGESGTGKERLARALHTQSARRTRPFVAVDCASLVDTLVASTLFGHERGAFTGAESRHVGAFERAQTGTLFLDEVGSLSSVAQAALLRVLQERTMQRVGGEETRHVDVRIVAASNQDLRHLAAAKTFREDLMYRLHVVPIHIPPLRDRREDIPLLVAHFLATYNTAYKRTVQGFTVAALERLRQYHWPGNVRELEHVIARLVVLDGGPLIGVEAIEEVLRRPEEQRNPGVAP